MIFEYFPAVFFADCAGSAQAGLADKPGLVALWPTIAVYCATFLSGGKSNDFNY